MRTRLMGLALAAALVSCSGSPEEKTPNSGSNAMNPNSSPNAVFTPNSGNGEDLAADLWGLICDAAFTCDGVDPQLLVVVGRYRNIGDCKANPLPNLELNTSQIDASVDGGRAQWDSVKAQECFQEIKDGVCEGGGLFETESSTCEEVIIGLVPEGGACATDEECANNLNCSSDGDNCYGTCVPSCGDETCTNDQYCLYEEAGQSCQDRVGVGATCEGFVECARGLDCDFDQGVCVARSSGSGFTQLSPGDPCSIGEGDITAYCAAGTVCTNLMLDGQQLTGTCSPPQAAGGTCRIAFECEFGLTCTAPTPLEEGTCVAAYADGEDCTQDFDCLSFNCDDGRCFTQPPEEVCMLP